ncbi:TPA: GNAT family N-acetyltransferase [Stenotrophomonas maltophilia]
MWIAEMMHGHGYGREAVAAVWSAASGRLRCAAFRYPVAEQNRSSRSLAESLGGLPVAREQGVKYTAIVYRNARSCDGRRGIPLKRPTASPILPLDPAPVTRRRTPGCPRWAVRAVCSAAPRCRSHPQQTFLAVAREVPLAPVVPGN